LLSCCAERAVAVTKVVLGDGMSVLDDEVGPTDEASAYDEWVRESDGAVDGGDPSVRGDGVLD